MLRAITCSSGLYQNGALDTPRRKSPVAILATITVCYTMDSPEKGRMPPAGQDVPGVQVERAQVVHGNCRPGGCPPLPRTGSNSNSEDSNFTDQLYGPRLPFCLGLPGYSVEVLGALGARAQLAPSPPQKPPRVCEVATQDVRDEGTLSQNGLNLNGYGISLSLSVSLGHTVVPRW